MGKEQEDEKLIGKLIRKRKTQINAFTKLLDAIGSNAVTEQEKQEVCEQSREDDQPGLTGTN
jgi:hypothetical protein